MLEKLLEEFGLRPAVWLLSFIVAVVMALYSIFERVPIPTRREVIMIILGAVICVILVPGVVYYVFKVDNPFMIAGATALCVHKFEKYLTSAHKKLERKIDMNDGKAD